jgi:negative regulator of sigma E activity
MNDQHASGQDGNRPLLSEEELLEELSAFMDGELDADRARFMQQRLGHDLELRARWERWQLLSSSLRRQAQPLPPGFSDRIARAVAEASASDSASPAANRHRTLRWAGGAALAASLAVAAAFVFDVAHTSINAAPQVAAAVQPAPILPIVRTSLPLPQPVIKLPIPVQSGVVTTFHSPLRPVLLRQQPQRASFAPFPQPYPIDPELEAYLQSQKTGAHRDVFTRDAVTLPDANDGAVRTVAWPQQ